MHFPVPRPWSILIGASLCILIGAAQATSSGSPAPALAAPLVWLPLNSTPAPAGGIVVPKNTGGIPVIDLQFLQIPAQPGPDVRLPLPDGGAVGTLNAFISISPAVVPPSTISAAG